MNRIGYFLINFSAVKRCCARRFLVSEKDNEYTRRNNFLQPVISGGFTTLVYDFYWRPTVASRWFFFTVSSFFDPPFPNFSLHFTPKIVIRDKSNSTGCLFNSHFDLPLFDIWSASFSRSSFHPRLNFLYHRPWYFDVLQKCWTINREKRIIIRKSHKGDDKMY